MTDGKQKPGVMIYFDNIRPALNRLNDEQCGSLFRAILDYAEYGVITDLEPITGMVFDLLRPKIDRDSNRYEESREQRQYAVYVREKQKVGEPYMKISEWRLSKYKPPDIGPISPDNGNIGSYPSTSTTTSTTTTTSPSTSTHTTGEVTGEGCKGEGEGEDQIGSLYTEWVEALKGGDNKSAMSYANQLFRLGYDADRQTGELRKRV